jgi:hypothetical protein
MRTLGAKLMKNGRKQRFLLLNKVKVTFFAPFLHQNVTFTFPFPYLFHLFVQKPSG